jgi:precorrin-3B synthase
VNAPHRRGACPRLSAPMRTGDGLLVRFSPTDSIALDAFRRICAAARRHGNGIMEITTRGSLQVRGLTERSAAAFADAVTALNIDAAEGVRVIVDPLADDPSTIIEPRPLAAQVRQAISDAQLALSPKACVIIDGGGRLHLDGLAADLRLRAVGSAQGPLLHVAIGGDSASATPFGTVEPESAGEVAVRLFKAMAEHGTAARTADIIRTAGTDWLFAAVRGLIRATPPVPPRPPTESIGRHLLRGGSFALGIAPAFGHATAENFCELADIARAHGALRIAFAPERILLLIAFSREQAAAVSDQAEGLGFITRSDDRRRRIVACSGKPACASGLIPARALAADIAAHVPALPALVHISGCAKGCAHAGPAPLTVVGTERGCGIVRNGSARELPTSYVEANDLGAEIAQAAGKHSETSHA